MPPRKRSGRIQPPAPEYADPKEVAVWASDVPSKYLECRDIGHSWRKHVQRNDEHGGFDRTLRCTRCKTVRKQILDSLGYTLSGWGGGYDYPDGYQAKGLGRIVADGKAALRLESIHRDLGE